jgi:voltage-dependent potassium channel beta subunit
MEYRKVGRWGIRVSEISVGSWLTYGGMVDEAHTAEQIHLAYDKGVNFFDTANAYGHGLAEQVLGRAIKTFNRDSIVLATKVFIPMGDGPNDRGLSRKHIFEQCHHSLRRLDTDYIDIYQCHRHDPEVPMYEIVRAMDDLCRQGKILYWGVSEWPAEKLEEAAAMADDLHAMPPISNQPQYNMLSRKVEETVIPVGQLLGMGQLVFSPLAQGVLTGKYKPSQAFPTDSRGANERVNSFMMHMLNKGTLEVVDQLHKIALELDMTMSQLALAWCLRLSEVSSVITGATKAAQIEENVKASGKKIPDAVLKKIDDLLKAPVRN